MSNQEILKTDQMGEIELLKQLDNFQFDKIELMIEAVTVRNIPYITSIGNSLCKLTNLKELILTFEENCILEFQGFQSIFNAVKQLINLEKLEISIYPLCFLEDKGLELLIDSLSTQINLKSLCILIFKSNYISAQKVKDLVNYFQRLPTIVELKLQIDDYAQQISEEKMNIWEGISQLSQIQNLNLTLNLKNNHEDDIDSLFNGLTILKNLTILKLSIQILQQKRDLIFNITNYLQKMEQLRELQLDIQGKLLSKREYKQLTTFFTKLPNLEVIDFKSMKEKIMEYRQEYLNSLSQLTRLKNIEFKTINDKSKDITTLENLFCKCLKSNQNLEEINFNFFGYSLRLDDEMLFQMTDLLKQQKKLQTLWFFLKCSISSNGYQQLSESFLHLNQLTSLYLSVFIEEYHPFQTLFEGIGSLVNLSTLSLNINNPSFNRDIQKYISFNFLKRLKLSFFKITMSSMIASNELIEFSQGLKYQDQLQKLELQIAIAQGDQLDSVNEIVEGFKGLKSLFELIFNVRFNSGLSNDQIYEIIDSLKYLQKLERFQMLNTQMSQLDQVNSISKSICQIEGLQLFNMYYHQCINEQVLIQCFQNLSNLRNLQFLHLNLNGGKLAENSYIPFEKLFSNINQLKNLEFKVRVSQGQNYILDLLKGIKHLQNLRVLKLEFGQLPFTDKDAQQFNESCGFLENLYHLYMDGQFNNPNFSLNGALQIYQGLSKLKKLKKFNGNFSVWQKEITQAIQGLFNLPSLNIIDVQIQSRINFYNNEILSEVIELEDSTEKQMNPSNSLTSIKSTFHFCQEEQIPSISQYYSYYKNCPHLNSLQINHEGGINKINPTQLFQNLAQAFQKFQKLESLQLIFKSSSNYDLNQIPIHNLKHLVHLKELKLDLSSNQIEADHLLYSQIQNLTNLQILKIDLSSETQFSKKAAISLGNSFKKLKQLQELEFKIDQNSIIEEEGAIQIGQGLGYLVNLQQLQIFISKNCGVDQLGGVEIGNGISKLINLQTIYLSIQDDNKIDIGGVSIASSLKNCKQLHKITIEISKGNNQGQEFLSEIFKSLNELENKIHLSLQIHFSEQLLSCPKEFKQFLAHPTNNKIYFQFSDRMNQCKSCFYFKREQSLFFNIQFIFEYQVKNYYPFVELESLSDLPKNIDIQLQFEIFNSGALLNHFLVKESIKKIKPNNLEIQLTLLKLQEEAFTEIIEPSLIGKDLWSYNLILQLEENIEMSVLEKIGQSLSTLNLRSLKLQFKSPSDLHSYEYGVILKHLKNSPKLSKLTLLSNYNEIDKRKVKKNMSHIIKLVDFNLVQQILD